MADESLERFEQMLRNLSQQEFMDRYGYLASSPERAKQNLYGDLDKQNLGRYVQMQERLGRPPTTREFWGTVSEQGKIEEAGLRQKEEILSEATKQDELRKSRRSELANLLAQQSDRLFSENQPFIAEDANAAGIYTGTGFSEALAKEKGRLASSAQEQLAMQGLTDTDALLDQRSSALSRSQGFQEAGLSRNFSLDDYMRQAQLSRELGSLQEVPVMIQVL